MTIAQVAEAAGVSLATVSRALRGLEGVSRATGDRVRRAAADLDYVASPTAASLASGRTRTVGVVAPLLTRWVFAALVSSIEWALRDHGYSALLLDLQDLAGSNRQLLTRSLLWRRVDGLVIVDLALTEREIALVRELRLPSITVGNRITGCPAVSVDPAQAVSVAVEHLIGLGHRDIAYLGAAGSGPEPQQGQAQQGQAQQDQAQQGRVQQGQAQQDQAQQRLQAFQRSLRRHGIAVAPSRLSSCEPTASAAVGLARTLLAVRRRPTAIVTGCDEIAIGVLAAARRCRLRVPEDVSVTGCDDHPFAEALGLTTVRHDLEAHGTAAATILARALQDADAGSSGRTLVNAATRRMHVVIPSRLIIRESTAPAPRPGQA